MGPDLPPPLELPLLLRDHQIRGILRAQAAVPVVHEDRPRPRSVEGGEEHAQGSPLRGSLQGDFEAGLLLESSETSRIAGYVRGLLVLAAGAGGIREEFRGSAMDERVWGNAEGGRDDGR